MKREKSYWWGLLTLGIVSSFLYLSNQVLSIYGGDAGDLVSAIATYGIPHPPGYPLYTLLGLIITKTISFGTFAWRIGFLSSLPAVGTLLIIYDLFYYLSKRVLSSLISVFVLAFLYPIWLYSEVVEVFALNNFFIVFLLWLLFHWYFEGKPRYFYLASLIFGLSLTHHHIIVFLLPALIFLLQRKKQITKKILLLSLVLFLTGLLPYSYVFISASFNPAVNWLGPSTLKYFLELVTRAGYGTFRSGGSIGHEPILRLANVWAFWDLVYKDFRILGIILFVSGAFYLIKYKKTIFFVLSLGLLSYLFFIFYASFPLPDNFYVATFERFVQPLYLLMTFFIVFGFNYLEVIIAKVLSVFDKRKRKIILRLALFLFFLYPISLFLLNYHKISILKNDFSAENLGKDILNSLPKGSILIISSDTSLFDTQYVYYTEKKWPEVKLIHWSKLYTSHYQINLAKYYPDLVLSDKTTDQTTILNQFLERNYSKFPIFSKLAIQGTEGIWVPYGLVFRYFKNTDAPSDNQVMSDNESLWSLYHDPLSGSLSAYQNLMLSDILTVYAIAQQEIGYWEAKRGFNQAAEKHLLEAIKLTPKDLDSYTILAQVYITEKRCSDAQKQIEKVISKDPKELSSYLLQSINYAICFKNREKASYYEQLYKEKAKEKETQLLQL